MKVAITTGFTFDIPFERKVRLIREAGFEKVSLGALLKDSNCYVKEGRESVNKILKQNNIKLDCVHAPFPEADNLFSLDEEKRQASIRECKVGIDAAVDLNGRVVVVHLIQPYGIKDKDIFDKMVEKGIDSVREVADYAYKKKIMLALENGQKQDYDDVVSDFLLKEFPSYPVGFCYDSGHEYVKDKSFKMLEKFGSRLLCVHIHDNSGRDTHVLPFEGSIDWEGFKKVFQKINFPGDFLLETDMHNSQFKDPAVFLSEAKKRAEKLL